MTRVQWWGYSAPTIDLWRLAAHSVVRIYADVRCTDDVIDHHILKGQFHLQSNVAGTDSRIITAQNGIHRSSCWDCTERCSAMQMQLGKVAARRMAAALVPTFPGVLRPSLASLRRNDEENVVWQALHSLWSSISGDVNELYATVSKQRPLPTVGSGLESFDGGGSSCEPAAAAPAAKPTLKKMFKKKMSQLLTGGSAAAAARIATGALLGSATQRRICRSLYSEHHSQPPLQPPGPSVLSVSVGTWNVAGSMHVDELPNQLTTLRGWLVYGSDGSGSTGRNGSSGGGGSGGGSVGGGGSRAEGSSAVSPCGDLGPDIIAVGFQEILPLTPGNIINPGVEEVGAWGKELDVALGTEYGLVTCEQLVGILLCVYVKYELLGSVKNVAVRKVMRGSGGKTGNKGAVMVQMTVEETVIEFCTVHLAAGDAKVAERNTDCRSILKRLCTLYVI